MGKPQQSYFHVVVCTSQAADKAVLVFSDLNERQFIKRFVVPYRTGGSVNIGKKIVRVSDLVAIKITETPQPKEATLKAMQERSLRAIDELNQSSVWPTTACEAFGWDDEDIMHADADVTERYITGRPGHPSRMTRVLHSRGIKVAAGTLAFLTAGLWIGL
ncbi:hypothetical protein [Ensifer sp. SSB1]|jgi:hypothetical protein|uniref:hypothetical protein n=1 Tax=Ensifer sp. SSB1 TaxID=2795385 RepID=UPI001A4AE0D6|nr:hypothetical protein [Ensifer sp. SSB1]MBK5566946.1 hypothetical protein [Ensifer sp. SSB1]